MRIDDHGPASSLRLRPAALGPGALMITAWLALGTGAASAANYSMTGFMRDFRGPLQVPMGETLLQDGRGIPAAGTLSQTGPPVPGGGPATILFPAPVIVAEPKPGGFLIPLPSIIQITTNADHQGPLGTSPTLMASRTQGPPTFAYCPGAAANPSCTAVSAGGSQGTLNGIVKYTAGPNRFGGTLKLLTQGLATLVRKGNPLPPTHMTTMGATKAALPFSAVNYAVGGTATLHAGGGYAQMFLHYLAPMPRTHPYGYMETPKGLLSLGPVVGPGVAASDSATGFPLTTGQVYQYAKLGTQGSPGLPVKRTVTGYDHRTSLGAGRIHLVAGSLARAYPTDGSNPPEGSAPGLLVMWLTMVPQPALPLSSPAFQLTLSALILLSAGFAVSANRRMR